MQPFLAACPLDALDTRTAEVQKQVRASCHLFNDLENAQVLVGELVGARLIAHAGSLLNLAKQPASTVQILGAEKALFRALKTKHEARAGPHTCTAPD